MAFCSRSTPCAILFICLLALAVLPSGQARRHFGHGRHLAQTNSSAGYCASEGPAASSTFMNASVTCNKFWSTGAPIHVPKDNKTVKYGQLFPANTQGFTTVFMDRAGKQYLVSPAAKPPSDTLQLMQIWVLLVVQAEVKNNTVISFKPIIYVPYSTVMTAMTNTQFEGTLFNSDPRPAGPEQVNYIRWSFGTRITVTNATQKYGTLLRGTFDNLFTPVKDSKGKCRPALCGDPSRSSAACKYYIEFFGNKTNAMTLNWDPNMHTPTDTELVPMFDTTNRQYMSGFTELFTFLTTKWKFVPHKYVFVSHGSPMGVPQNFTGTLSPLKKAVPCLL